MNYKKLISGLVLFGLPCISLIIYYSFFINKGIVLGDEGYYLHIADRILQGEVPYKDFFLQYPPGHFYILALFFKLFGISVITGRIITLAYCLAIFSLTLYFLYEYKSYSRKSIIITLLCTASFGFPLLNIPIVVWPSVLLTILMMIFLLKWYRQHKTSSLLILGILISAQFFVKQNIAIVELVLINLLLILKMDDIQLLIKRLLYLNIIWVLITAGWVIIFFRYDSFTTFYEFINFNQRYLSLYPFTYPPLTYLFEPTGFFKLLPYYLPIFFFILLIVSFIRKKLDKKQAVFFLPLIGFFTTIYPTSDLLHVYPYLGLMLIGLYIYAKDRKNKLKFVLYGLISICILLGFYLTLFREYYRYQLPYNKQNTLLNLPRTDGIYIDENTVHNITEIFNFINKNTSKNDPIFIYSFSPIYYFLLERPNPSKYSIYFPGYLSDNEESEVIKDIYRSDVRFVVTDSFSISDRPLSKWIYENEKVESFGQFSIFRVDSKNLP